MAQKFGLTWVLVAGTLWAAGVGVEANTGSSGAGLVDALPATNACPACREIIRSGEARLTVGYALPGGGSVMLWLGRNGRRAFGQSYSAAGLPQGAEFVINISGSNGLLPIVFPQPGGGFALRWERMQGDRMQALEQHYGADGMPRGEVVLRDD